MHKKNLIIIAALAVIFLLIGLGFLFLSKTTPTPLPSPTPSSTPSNLQPGQSAYPSSVGSDWETYSNSKYNYSLKYPAGWATIINTTPTSKSETLPDATSLDIFDSAAQKSYPEGVMTIQYFSQMPDFPDMTKTDVNIGGKNGQKFVGMEQGFTKEIYLITQGQGVIEVDIRYSPGDSIKATFDAMLSTLKIS
ncbi:hypothetical protein A3B45_00950 [Candidatus Daviesbacteria bacterium RIFCSPLOWO2_01_FULL_39_12]|uniref:PsbP C-terminal domain-containing protein n=1 Tax=Candidatus Daviesbacteria bacterium RIFCSPLOWO2_01_FULL_39_12 TaxID=1797785 RepID=A0A1F5KTK5_9BACT|nr:MAG: hypothetical protein A3B45_00950 [Candidatus Daviesbacteria bacterium RIFCSPLOWO2_01_FULL_39_12]